MIRKLGLVALFGLLFVGFFSSSASAYEHGFRGGYRGTPVRRVEPVRRGYNYGWGWGYRHHHRYNPYYPYYRAW
jgi:hypothetical protein